MRRLTGLLATVLLAGSVRAGYVNFESSHVHPIALTPSGDRLLVVNTPDSLLEVFAVQGDGSLLPERAIPVGLEPVTVRVRNASEAWVVNNLSDSISIVDLNLGIVVKTLKVGDEPTDVVFAENRAFVAASTLDRVEVYSLTNFGKGADLDLFSRDVRALALSPDGTKVYAVMLKSGNQTTVVNASIANNLSIEPPAGPPDGQLLHYGFYETFDVPQPFCADYSAPPPPQLPLGIVRNPELIDPPDGVPKLGIMVRWSQATETWRDTAGKDWTECVHYEMPDQDLFVIDASTLSVTPVSGLGTTLFDVSVNPANGRIYVPNTDARNFVRFEHPLGLRGHAIDDRLSVVDPAKDHALTVIDLNTHIDRESDPQTNVAERLASVSQPGMMVWRSDGSVAYMTALGSRKVFRVDGSCLSGACIFGPDRANPVAVEVGLGPSGVALREATDPALERLYVLNRISHTLAIVKTATMEKLAELPLHDPSSAATRIGRNFLYDAFYGSAHGDAACSSCHPSGDMDGLAWELGNPEGDFVPYTKPYDSVKFLSKGGEVVPGISEQLCDENGQPKLTCADHRGFDPQKGPMVTQTLRGLLEPLHWRGDRATFRDFNQTFVNLLGVANLKPPGQIPAGITDEEMEQFRQFALEIRFPPNPNRKVDDTTPCGLRSVDPNCQVMYNGNYVMGNPTEGEQLFKKKKVWAGDRNCTVCHQLPHGTFSGTLGGVEPSEPTSDAMARVRAGMFDAEFPGFHSDVKVPQLRNLYDKVGTSWTWWAYKVKGGTGFTHDGSVPDLPRLATTRLFNLHPANAWQDLRDLVAFLFTFPTGTRPAVGQQVTLPAGTPPTGSAADEALLATLAALGDLTDVKRHCELVASTLADGRQRSYRFSGGSWLADVAGEPPLSTQALRESAQAPITFTCGTLDSGVRLGGDRDEDGTLNGDDCAPADATTAADPLAVAGLALFQGESTLLSWQDQAATVGTSVRYEVLTGAVSALAGAGIEETTCLAAALEGPSYTDVRPDPAVGDGYYYLVRAVNPCGVGGLAPGQGSLGGLSCE